MNKKRKIKKSVLYPVLFLLFMGFFFLFRSRSYEIQYTVDEVLVTERYYKKEKMYQYVFRYQDRDYVLNVKGHAFNKKLVKKVEVKSKEETTCLQIEGNLPFYPVCSEASTLLSYHLVDKELIPEVFQKKEDASFSDYNNYKIYDLNKKTFFIWNYKGFDVISEKKKTTVPLYSKDIYTIPLTIKVGEAILMADYQATYEFSKFFVIQKNGKVKEMALDSTLSFESYFLGVHKKSAYLMDKKNKKEYEIYPSRLAMRTISKDGMGKIYNQTDFEAVTLNSLSTSEKFFTVSSLGDFSIENDQKLYYKTSGTKVKITDEEVKAIIEQNGEEVYYLVQDELRYYNLYSGEKKILSSFEWNFNYKNMIYIF